MHKKALIRDKQGHGEVRCLVHKLNEHELSSVILLNFTLTVHV
jgi:hypothetical protein